MTSAGLGGGVVSAAVRLSGGRGDHWGGCGRSLRTATRRPPLEYWFAVYERTGGGPNRG